MGRRPSICLSLNCKDLNEIREELNIFLMYSDIVELCADKLEGIESLNEGAYNKLLLEVKSLIGNRELIVDYKGEEEVKNRILRWSMAVANIIDVDYNDAMRDKLINEAKEKEAKVLLSFHNFEGMFKANEIVAKYHDMEKTGAHILKIACMANKKEDMYEILSGAREYSSLASSKPIVAIAMGKLGEESRVCMGDFGSTISYACGSKPTAPGQFNAKTLREYFNKYYENN